MKKGLIAFNNGLYTEEELAVLHREKSEEAYDWNPKRLRDAIYSFVMEKYKKEIDGVSGQFQQELALELIDKVTEHIKSESQAAITEFDEWMKEEVGLFFSV